MGCCSRCRKTYIDGRVGLVGVLDFRFCQCRATVKTPVHRLEPSVDETFFDDGLKRTKLVGLILEVHGLVGLLPLAKDTQSNEVFLLSLNLLLCIGPRL